MVKDAHRGVAALAHDVLERAPQQALFPCRYWSLCARQAHVHDHTGSKYPGEITRF